MLVAIALIPLGLLDIGAFPKWVISLLLDPKQHKYKILVLVKEPQAMS